MTPAYRVLVDGADITARIQERLISLTVRDESGYESDSASLRIDDRDGRVALPRRGVRMEVSIGYEEIENEKEQKIGLVRMGSYTVDEVEVVDPPLTLNVRARAIDFRATLKQRKTRSWEDTLGNIVSRIAAEHGLRPRVNASLADLSVPHIDQTEESDLNFLTRLGRRYDAVAKPAGPAGSFLIFVPLGQGVSATGRPVNVRTIRREQAGRYRAVLVDRPRYQSVRAHWISLAGGAQETVRVGQGEPVDTLPRTYPTEAEARAAATSRLQSLTRDGSSLSLTLHPGDPLMAAESRLALTGFRTGLDGNWIATRVTHEIRPSAGFTTRLDAHRPTAGLA